MIAKHVAMRSLGRSDFAGLVSYITATQGKTERLGAVLMTNCESGTLQAATEEVLATQRLNTRARGDKTYHLLISFRASETPTADVLQAIEARLCAGLGYGEHQRISAVHHDTDHLHFHIAINKIHPIRLTMHEPYYPHRTLATLCSSLEQEFGLEPDNHQARKSRAENRAADMERQAGIESLVGWIQRNCLDAMIAAPTWAALHQVLHDNGLVLRIRANGFVIESGDGTQVKASTVARTLSRPKLEARLGPFDGSPVQSNTSSPRRTYQQEPVRSRINTSSLYARYQAEQETRGANRTAALKTARNRKSLALEDARRLNRLHRATIRLVDGKGFPKKLVYAQAHAAMQARLSEIRQDYTRARQGIYQAFQRRTWADWLKQQAQQGDREALAALRAREVAQGLRGNVLQAAGRPRAEAAAPVLDSVTKQGTVIFRLGRCAVRDDGDRLQVSREATPEGLQAALRLALARYGDRIQVSGTPEFKAQIVWAAVTAQLPLTFVDPGLEQRRNVLLSPPLPQEKTHERTDPSQRGCADRRDAGRAGTGPQPRSSATRGPVSITGQPHPGRIGRDPPAQGRHHLRTLSELGVVRFSDRGEMLLPGDVPHHLAQPEPAADHALRRGFSGSGLSAESIAAALHYIAERDAKRSKNVDIPKHALYIDQHGLFSFEGIRHVEGQHLALLRHGPMILVKPIDLATVYRLRRIAVGDRVSITPQGLIKTSTGRSR